ncbi:fibrinogen-like YCDxxxxGGGW domain-containing protein [Chondromyces crocatus]|uniref:Fibrinogen C-terminal domain-containing protein n=1 Tax=Chondromyces crocatus TaxID=52 RepID=A0A0K1EAY2_CHOCO|nr:fibrinogen-like YCDxxxxGGGW domain-containing protein [Chondromyces crocatus]AKT38041.1 uncharacterized protein CMC5_021820 [Chondromyces crocatus]
MAPPTLRSLLLAGFVTSLLAVAAQGCGDGAVTSAVPCEGGLTRCGDGCVDPQGNPDHCGACGVACDDGEACIAGACAASVCTPGEAQLCYTGPEGTQGVGACKGGAQACDASGASYGACVGEVTPIEENCDTPEDDDCDGQVNEDCAYRRCTDLPAGTPSGVFLLDPDGSGPVEPFAAYCEMELEGGGWTLVASVADRSYFSDTSCYLACGNANQVGACNEERFKAADTAGDVESFTFADHKSDAYAVVPFREFLFVDSEGQYASYLISSAVQSNVSAWYPAGMKNWVPLQVEEHSTYSYPVAATNIPLEANNCGTLRLSFNVEDSDTPMGAGCHEIKKGPVWPKFENDGCYWDEAGISWVHDSFYKDNNSTYRLWLVR